MNKKTERFLLIAYVLSLMFMLVGATYAYFSVIRVSNVSPVIEVDTAQLDSILFDAGFPISIYADNENFQKGMGSITSDTFARAYLKTNGENVTYKYNLFLDLLENNFVYSTEDKKAEIILKVIDPFGNELKSLDGLEYVTSNGVSGFDITDKKGKFYIARDYSITTSNEIMHKWSFYVTFVNLETNQEVNHSKKLNGYVKIEKGE